MKNNKNYFKVLFKSWHFIFALLLTSLAMTFVCASYDYGILSKIFSDKILLTFAIILFVLISVAVIVYLCLRLKNEKLTIADSLYLTLIFIGIAFFIFIGFNLKTFTLNRFTVAITFLIVGLFFTTIRIHQYSICIRKKSKTIK